MKQKDILFLLISASTLVLAWIIFSIYHKSVTSTIPESLNVQIIPINPDFDTKTIEKLKKRKAVSPVYELIKTKEESSTESSQLLTPPTPSPTITKSATQGGSLTP